MGRGDDEARPPIEILGVDPGVESTLQVALGPRHAKPGKGRSLAIVAALVVVLGAGLILGGRDDDGSEGRDEQSPRTSTTARGSTTTRPTTTTTAPGGPPFGQPIEGVLLIYSGEWTRTDLTTGAVSSLRLPPANFYDDGAVSVKGGLVLPSGGGMIWYVSVLGTEKEPPHVVLGPGDRAARAGDDRVWIFDDFAGPDDAGPPITDVRLVGLDGQVLRSFQVPAGSVENATADVVIVSRGGRVYAADEDGIRPLATGWPVGTLDHAVLVLACDDRGACAIEMHPTDGGAVRALIPVVDPERLSYQSVDAPDGRLAVLQYDNFGLGSHLLVLDASGAEVDTPDFEVGEVSGAPQLLPGDLGFLLFDGEYLQHIHLVGDTWTIENVATEPGRAIEGAFVITP